MSVVRQAYASSVDRYIELFGRTAAVHPDDLALIGRHLAILDGPVLDVGCGPGHLTGHLRSLGVEASGVDLVPDFVDHARAVHADCAFEIGSMHCLDAPTGSLHGVLAWYSLIHMSPDEVDVVLRELRRAVIPGGRLVVGFFDGGFVAPFAHKVTTAYHWPVDEMTRRLAAAGFDIVERVQRPADSEAGVRAHAAIAANAS